MWNWSKKVLAILMSVIIIAFVFSAEMSIFAENNAEALAFNLFRDAGEITDEFIAETTELCNSNWNDHYFSSIIMTFGDMKISVDGKEVTISQPASIDDDGEIMLPVMDLAEALGAEAEIDQEAGDITIEENGEKTNLDVLSAASLSDTISSDVKDVVVSENNTIDNQDGSTLTKLPAISASQAEEVWRLDVHRDGDKIIIT